MKSSRRRESVLRRNSEIWKETSENEEIEKSSKLKSARSKRTIETSDTGVDKSGWKVPPKKRPIASRVRSTRRTVKKKNKIIDSGPSENSESSHEEWQDPEVKSSKVTKRLRKSDFYECLTCEMTFVERRLYRRHLERHRNTINTKRDCETCGRKFKNYSTLKSHIRYTHKESLEVYNCTMCNFTTKRPYNLQEHFTRKHTEETKYECNVCGKHYKSKPDYKVHLGTHEDGPQICDICGITYPNKVSLYSHRYYKHTEKAKPFECTICKKRLTTEKNLESHMLQHNQSYVCELCGMKFGRQAGLSKHRKIHAEKSFLCTVCGRAFANMTTQRVHMVTHSGVRPYSCDVCGSSYTQRSSLMLHWRKKHPEATEPPPPVTLVNISHLVKPDAN